QVAARFRQTDEDEGRLFLGDDRADVLERAEQGARRFFFGIEDAALLGHHPQQAVAALGARADLRRQQAGEGSRAQDERSLAWIVDSHGKAIRSRKSVIAAVVLVAYRRVAVEDDTQGLLRFHEIEG